MRISRNDIDIEKIQQLDKQKHEIYKQKQAYKQQVEERLQAYDDQCAKIEKQTRDLFPRGYWWSYDIDKHWKYPKKYSIKSVSLSSWGEIYITVKEVFKKKPWPGFTGETLLDMDKFSKVDMYATEEEAKLLYSKRICPKCGGYMWSSKNDWCDNCIADRWKRIKDFEDAHQFYCPADENVYHVHYEDEFTSENGKGFYGRHFVLRRLDTGEVIHTNNLCACGPFQKDKDTLPHIEFLEGDFS